MLRRAVIAGLLVSCAVQPVFGDDFKFKVNSNKDFELVLTTFGGPLMMLDACWSSASADLDWLLVCDFPGVGVEIAALSDSDEEKCEDFQIGLFGGEDGLVCAATLFSSRGTGKGNGALRYTGTETLDRRGVRAVPMSVDELPGFREKIDQVKAASRKRKRGN